MRSSATPYRSPDGQISKSVSSPFLKNISIPVWRKSLLHPSPSNPSRGVSRSSRTRGGTRWTQAALLTRAWFCGRQSRVVLTPRRWCQVLEKQASCKFLGGDGGKKARSPGRARNKPYNHRAGNAGLPGEPVVTNSCAFYLCARGCGRVGRPAFPAPSVFRRPDYGAKLGRVVPREYESVA